MRNVDAMMSGLYLKRIQTKQVDLDCFDLYAYKHVLYIYTQMYTVSGNLNRYGLPPSSYIAVSHYAIKLVG